jgi:hyperosmotically inducible periplasmic protein
MSRVTPVAPVLLALALVLSACGAAVRDNFDDATISTRVKTALLNDLAITATTIDVETVKGVVTLSGRVKTKDDETRAIALARTVTGVSDVKSALKIQP